MIHLLAAKQCAQADDDKSGDNKKFKSWYSEDVVQDSEDFNTLWHGNIVALLVPAHQHGLLIAMVWYPLQDLLHSFSPFPCKYGT